MSGLKNLNLNEPKSEKRKDVIISKQQKAALLFGYWLISECITVIILFYSIYAAKELGLSSFLIGITLLIVQLIGFPATYYGGKLATTVSALRLLGLSVILWGVIIGLLVLNFGVLGLIAIVILTGLVIGNSQSFLRAQYSTIIDKSEAGFQFGIYSFISQAAVFIGPVIYGVASDYLNSQRKPLIALFILMALGYGLIWKTLNEMAPIQQEFKSVQEAQE
jgi:MFS-type transporter involved in bile tolerance (Atg22 family)